MSNSTETAAMALLQDRADKASAISQPEAVDPKPAVIDDFVMEPLAEDVDIAYPDLDPRDLQYEKEAPGAIEISQPASEQKDTRVHKHRVILDFSITSSNLLKSVDTIVLPSASDKTLQKTIENLPNMPLADSDEGRIWAGVARESLNKESFGEMYDRSLSRPESEWRQYVPHNEFKLAGGYPRYPNANGTTMAGSEAVVRMLRHLGLGSVFQAPMWHSGFWVSFKPATESAIVDLNMLIATDKIEFGRYSYGLAFSNLTAYTTERLMRFAEDHIYDTTIRAEDLNGKSVLSVLKAQDIPMFLHGMLCSMYPRGFNFRRACCNNPVTCKHVAEETINLRYLNHVDCPAFTTWQKTHLTKRSRHTVPLADVMRYQDELAKLQKRQVTIKQESGVDMVLELRSPSVIEHIHAGHAWIDSMTTMVEESLGKDVSTGERNTMLNFHGKASLLVQYSHWISHMTYDDIEVADRETMNMALAQLSADDILREQLLGEVKTYIEDSTIAVIGIPTYDCPACGTPQAPIEGKQLYTEIIPLDVIQVFMLLVNQRIARLTRRE